MRIRKNDKRMQLLIALLLTALVLTGCDSGEQAMPEDLDEIIEDTAAYVLETTPAPTIQSVGGEWAVMGLKYSGVDIDEEYFRNYYDNVRAIVKSQNGILTHDRYTEYARVCIAFDSIDKDPRDIEGHDLTLMLDEHETILAQGLNAVSFALIAANVTGTELESEDAYVEFILSELDSGNYYGTDNKADYVSMALQSLSYYSDEPGVAQTIDEGIKALSDYQSSDGSLGNCESTSECIIALSQLGIDVFSDKRFVKDGNSLGDGLLKYRMEDRGFSHSEENDNSDSMASEKALLALDSIKLVNEGYNLYIWEQK